MTTENRVNLRLSPACEPYACRVSSNSRIRRRYILAFLVFYCSFALVGTVLAGRALWLGIHAVRGEAEIVTTDSGRGVATVKFIAPNGRVCTDVILYSADHDKGAGERISIRYVPRQPCPVNVRAADSTMWWLFILVPIILLIAGLATGLLVLRRKPAE